MDYVIQGAIDTLNAFIRACLVVGWITIVGLAIILVIALILEKVGK
ncbi:membrane protein [Gordonia phage Camerico]|nr:membrane protein [Gordonia phage Camerico]